MLVVATSLCCATFNMLFLAVILCCAVIALLFQRFGARFFIVYQNDGVVIVELLTEAYSGKHDAIMDTLNGVIAKGRLDSISENTGTTVISYNFQKMQESALSNLQQKLRMIHPDIKLNIFYNNNNAV
jgi:hypothetical protein